MQKCFMFAMEIFQNFYKTKQKVEYFQYLVGEQRETKETVKHKVKKKRNARKSSASTASTLKINIMKKTS